MADILHCSNCRKELKSSWLVCHHCHQARWKLILPYYFGGVSFLVIGLLSLNWMENMVLLCGGGIFGLLGVIMLLIGGIATLRGLTVRKVGPAPAPATPRPAAVPAPASTPAPAAAAAAQVLPPMVFELSGGVLPGVDKTILDTLDRSIASANREPQWEQLAFAPGPVGRALLPLNICGIFDHLLTDHALTRQAALEHLFKLGSEKLRETLIRVLGTQGTPAAARALQVFAREDPWRANLADDYNSRSPSNAPLVTDWGYPLRELAVSELEKMVGK